VTRKGREDREGRLHARCQACNRIFAVGPANTTATHYRHEPWLSWAETTCATCGHAFRHFFAGELLDDLIRAGCVRHERVAPAWVAEFWAAEHGLAPVRAQAPSPVSVAESVVWDAWLRDASTEDIMGALGVEPAGPISVVIADDDPNILRLERLYLIGDGRFTVVGQARDGDEVLQVVNDSQPDALVLDVMMPGTDGLSALRTLTTVVRPPRVVLYSAYVTPTVVAAARRFGASVVEKGKSLKVLVDALAATA